MLAAAIGIGSNSLRMLIAQVDPVNAQLHRILRDREGLRVFAALDEKGAISREMMDKAAQSVRAFVEKARSYPVERIHLFATSAVRDASNQQAFCDRIQQAVGIRPDVCSGALEARLSFLGGTDAVPSGMIDIGGGSTEIVMGQGARIDFSTSLQIGAVRLFQEIPIQGSRDAYRVMERAAGVLASQCHFPPKLAPKLSWVGVGGTFTTAAALIQDIPWSSKEDIHGFWIHRDAARRCMEELACLDMPARLALRGLSPQRADIVVHGLAILLSCMEALGIDRIQASEYGNLEGYLKMKYFEKS
ncbi:MAG: hypothetical protein VB099_07830 [Candidatus Limiplasma sp.]|nr:hypothetical protein [Candidatus Limiplasma sp.]